VRITLKKAYADGTIAVDMDPLSLLWSASHQRAPIAPAHHPLRGSAGPGESVEMSPYRPWAELLARTFALDVLACPK
jgi:hypothetical protein